ncbi:MAG: tRNA 2-thiocytidine(32) synthetase TtcA, partial [Morganella morganii]
SSHLCDTELFDFKSIHHGSEVVDGGDLAFDRETLPVQPVWEDEDDDGDSPDFTELRLDVTEVK